MKIIFYDGSTMTCNHIAIYGDELIIDDYRIVSAAEVNEITEED